MNRCSFRLTQPHVWTLVVTVCMFWLQLFSHPSLLLADEPEREGDWIRQYDRQRAVTIYSMEMTLHPRAEPVPALKYCLVPDDYDRRDGNSAIFYLKAMGFFEQNPAREALSAVWKKAMAQAEEHNTDFSQVAPHVWLNTPPDELPTQEVKNYLQLMSFQPQYLAEAALRRSFTLDRNIREIDQPIAYPLPEIQVVREAARVQSIRCRLAIAEGRVDDAIAILGQQYSMANHLGTDEFLVSTLVGAGVSGMAWVDALYLLQHADTPNLYWALASLPSPVIGMQQAFAYERQFLYEQLKVLREVSEKPRNAGYWQDFVDRLMPQLEGMSVSGFDMGNASDPEYQRGQIVAFIAAAYPGAKRYLLEELGMDSEQLSAYPTAQVVFLAMRRSHDEFRDEYYKWRFLPLAMCQTSTVFAEIDEQIAQRTERIGFAAQAAVDYLPAVSAVRTAQARVQQCVALLQTVEAIRDFGAKNKGELPKSLADLPLPAPDNPVTGEALDYDYNGNIAVLSCGVSYLQYRLVLKFE